MTFIFDANNAPITGDQAFFKFKALLKTAGWTVPSSSDGLTVFPSSDGIVGFGSGAGQIGNSLSWFRIKQPSAVGLYQREFMIQRASFGGTGWLMRYSLNGFTGGSPTATVPPTASDQQHVRTDFDFPISFMPTDNTYRWNAGADNASPYGFWACCYQTGSPGHFAAGGGIIFDPLKAGSYPIADQDPYVITFDDPSSGTFNYDKLGHVPSCYYGLCDNPPFPTEYNNSAMSRMSTAVGTTGFIFPNGLDPNPFTGKDEECEVLYAYPSPSNNLFYFPSNSGTKGIGTIARWNGTQRNTGCTHSIASASSKERIVMGDINLPWNGTNPLDGTGNFQAQLRAVPGFVPAATSGNNIYEMQAVDSITGDLYRWLFTGASPDFAGTQYPGPNSPTNISLAGRPL